MAQGAKAGHRGWWIGTNGRTFYVTPCKRKGPKSVRKVYRRYESAVNALIAKEKHGN